MKVNYRHQLCAANFATLQLWRRRSLESGNCRRQSRERKFERVAVRAANRISKIHRTRPTFLPLKTISSPPRLTLNSGWKVEKVKVGENEERKVKVIGAISYDENFSCCFTFHSAWSIYFSDAIKCKIPNLKSTQSYHVKNEKWKRSILTSAVQ